MCTSDSALAVHCKQHHQEILSQGDGRPVLKDRANVKLGYTRSYDSIIYMYM